MPENDFEKQVQEKMGGFNLVPDPGVWNSVEKRIREEKKRRFVFLWLFMALLAGGICTTFIIISNKKDTATASTNIPVPVKDSTSEINKNNITTIDQNEVYSPGNSHKPGTTDVPVAIDKKRRVASTRPNSNGIIVTGQNKTIKPKIVVSANRVVNDAIKTMDPSLTEDQKNKPLIQSIPVVNTKKNNPAVDEAVTEPRQPPRATSAIADPGNKNDSMALVEIKKTPIREWSLVLSAGRSSLINGFNLFENKMYADNLFSSPGSGPAAPVTGPIRGVALKPGFSLSAGLFMKKPLNKRLDWGIGMSYQYLSNRFQAGNRIDSVRTINNSYSQDVTVNSYYRPGVLALSSNESAYYTNQYHFLGLSAELSWKVIDNENFKLQWMNGLTYNRLIASTMLHYDKGLRAYYKDNERLRKNQLFFNTGLSFPVTNSISISPFASFSLTRVLKADSARHRYSNFGLQVRISLNKK